LDLKQVDYVKNKVFVLDSGKYLWYDYYIFNGNICPFAYINIPKRSILFEKERFIKENIFPHGSISTSIIVNVDGQPIILAKFDDQQTTNSVYKKFIRDVEKIKKGEYYAYAYRFSKFFHKGKVVKFNKKVNDFTNKKEGIQ